MSQDCIILSQYMVRQLELPWTVTQGKIF